MNEESAVAHHLFRLLTNRHGFFAIFNVPVPGPAFSIHLYNTTTATVPNGNSQISQIHQPLLRFEKLGAG